MLVSSLLKLNFVEDLFIRPLWDTEVTENISKGKTSELIKSLDLPVLISIQVIEHGIEALSEWSPGNVFDSIEHPHSIIIVDESVTEDSCGLMCPESEARVSSVQCFVSWHSHTTNNFRDISQVKSVVRLQRSRL